MVYNGWNLVGVYNGSTVIQKRYFWGMDIGGPGQTADGIGALLMIQDSSETYVTVYDAMGNVHGLLKVSDGSLAAAYEYDAYGNTLRLSGPYGSTNPFRFATKYTHDDFNLVNFGRRHYSPSLGRFINRDPIEEQGGLHLYAYCRNNAVNAYDYLGMDGEIIMEDGGSGATNGIASLLQARMQAIIDSRRAGTGFDDKALWDGNTALDQQMAREEAQRALQNLINNTITNGGTVTVHDGDGNLIESATPLQETPTAPNNAGLIASSGDGMYSDGSIPYVTRGGEAGAVGRNGVPATLTLANQNAINAPGGKLTLGQANDHYRNGGGVPVQVDAQQYDFSKVNPSGFNSRGLQTYTFPSKTSSDFLVNGTVTLQLGSGGQTFHVLPDTYDFDMHSWTAQPFRNLATLGANVIANPTGSSSAQPFQIIFRGNLPLPQPIK